MTITLAEIDYQDLWQPVTDEGLVKQDSYFQGDWIEQCPKNLGTGYRHWIELRDIDLLIHDYRFQKTIFIQLPPDEGGGLECGFQLQGGHYASRCPGQSFVQSGPCLKERVREMASEKILQVDIHLASAQVLHRFVSDTDTLSPMLQKLIAGDGLTPFHQVTQTTPSMQTVLSQILHCPYQGMTRRMYLEGKCWELVALKLEQLNGLAMDCPVSLENPLTADDVDRIHMARNLLTEHWQNPPSLMQLARQVGLNDYKLKIGFRQVFGTTAFGYLWHYRMEQARQLLLERQLNIKEISQIVGYSKQSNFAAAFRKKFGLNPKVYMQTQGRGM